MSVVGGGLLLITIAVVLIGYWGIQATYRSASLLVFEDYPALDKLLRMDRDLYQAQSALERASRADNPLNQDAHRSEYE